MNHPQGRFRRVSGKVVSATFLILAGWGVPVAQAQSFQDLINEAHSQRDRYSGSRPPAYERPQKSAADRAADAWAKKMADQDAANAEHARKQKAAFDNLNTEAGKAFNRQDIREGLKFLRQLRIAHLDAGIYSPQLHETIARNEAVLAWNEAKSAVEFRRAIAIQPHLFTPENLRYVERLEAVEEYVRQRPERAAQEQAAVLAMHTMIDQLASTLADPKQSARAVLDHGTAQGAADDFRTRKSDAQARADDGTSEEHESIRSSLGFDTPGKLYIKERSTAPLVPIGRAVIPDRFLKHPAVFKLREFEAGADEARRMAAAQMARYEAEATKNPNSSALLVLLAGAKDAQSRADSAEHAVTVQIKEIERTVTFAPFDTGNSLPSPPMTPPGATTK
jgi:hypothetical protein